MTREELNKKKVLLSLNNKKYEKVAHSGTENFLAYRKKVLEGRAKMDALKRQSEMFNVTEANDKHYNDLVNTGMLIHAQNPLYGQQRDNTKYYKREGEPGKYRYYYTKEEYDAAHKSPQSGMEKVQQMHNEKESNVVGMIKDGNYYEKGEDGKYHKTDKKWEDVREQAIKEADNKIINAAKEGGYEAAKKAIFDDDRMLEMFGQFEGGFENHGWKLNDDGSITGMDEDDEKYFKNMEIWMRSFKDKTGIDIYKNKDFQKSVMDEIRNRYNMINNQTKEKESKIEGTKKYAAPENVGKNEETSKSIEKVADDAVKSVNETARKSDFNSKLNDTITNEGSDATADYIINNSPEWKEMVQAYKQAVNDGYIKMYRDGGKTVKNKGSKEIRDKFDPIFEKFEAVMQEAAKNPDFDRKGVEKLLNNELDNVIIEATENKYGVRDNTKKLAHEDSDPNTITTSEPLTPEQEYLNFKAKVEAGMKKQETIRHSMFIKSAKKQEAPKPIKPVYDNNKFDFYENVKKFKEEHPNVLSHGQNFKYYNKIDLGNGKSRYFYTKAEWDAYQDGLKRTAYENAKKAKTTSGGAKTEAAIEADKRTSYENSQKAKDTKKKIETTAKYNKTKDTETELWKSSAYARDFGNNELFTKVHDTYDLALAEAGGIDVKKLNGANPFYGTAGMVQRSQLLDKTNTDPEFEIKVVDLWKDKLSEDDLKELKSYMNKGHNKEASEHEGDRFDEKTVKQDVDYINKLTDVIKDHYHNGYKDGGNFYSSGIKSDGPALAKHLKDLYNNAVKNTSNEFEANKEFLNSLSKDDIHLILSAQDFYNSQINESSYGRSHGVGVTYTLPQNIDELLKILNQYKKPINKLTNEVVEKAYK